MHLLFILFFFFFNTVKPAYVVTSIKGSPALSGHFFRIP